MNAAVIAHDLEEYIPVADIFDAKALKYEVKTIKSKIKTEHSVLTLMGDIRTDVSELQNLILAQAEQGYYFCDCFLPTFKLKTHDGEIGYPIEAYPKGSSVKFNPLLAFFEKLKENNSTMLLSDNIETKFFPVEFLRKSIYSASFSSGIYEKVNVNQAEVLIKTLEEMLHEGYLLQAILPDFTACSIELGASTRKGVLVGQKPRYLAELKEYEVHHLEMNLDKFSCKIIPDLVQFLPKKGKEKLRLATIYSALQYYPSTAGLKTMDLLAVFQQSDTEMEFLILEKRYLITKRGCGGRTIISHQESLQDSFGSQHENLASWQVVCTIDCPSYVEGGCCADEGSRFFIILQRRKISQF